MFIVTLDPQAQVVAVRDALARRKKLGRFRHLETKEDVAQFAPELASVELEPGDRGQLADGVAKLLVAHAWPTLVEAGWELGELPAAALLGLPEDASDELLAALRDLPAINFDKQRLDATLPGPVVREINERKRTGRGDTVSVKSRGKGQIRFRIPEGFAFDDGVDVVDLSRCSLVLDRGFLVRALLPLPLVELDLSGAIVGELDNAVAAISAVVRLRLEACGITSEISDLFSTLAPLGRLEELALSRNALRGAWPAEALASNFPRLTALRVHGCNVEAGAVPKRTRPRGPISGGVPAQVEAAGVGEVLRSLGTRRAAFRELDVGANPRVGGAGRLEDLASFSTLERLDLGDIGLAGTAPQRLPPTLLRLSLGDVKARNSNRFEGARPAWNGGSGGGATADVEM